MQLLAHAPAGRGIRSPAPAARLPALSGQRRALVYRQGGRLTRSPAAAGALLAKPAWIDTVATFPDACSILAAQDIGHHRLARRRGSASSRSTSAPFFSADGSSRGWSSAPTPGGTCPSTRGSPRSG